MVSTEQLRFPLDIQFFGEEDKDPDIDPNEVKDDEVKEEGDKGEEKDGKSAKQSQSQNAKYAQMRREAEAKAKAEKEAQERALKKASDEAYRKGLREGIKVNPYTEEPIEDDYDLEIYEIQRQLDEQGKDPKAGLPRELARREREKAKAAKDKAEQEEKAESERKARYEENLAKKREEIKSVREKFNISEKEMEKLITDEKANPELYKQIKAKENRWTLEEIFDAYYKPEASEKRSTPNPTPSGASVKKSVKDMSDDEFIAHMKETYGGF